MPKVKERDFLPGPCLGKKKIGKKVGLSEQRSEKNNAAAVQGFQLGSREVMSRKTN